MKDVLVTIKNLSKSYGGVHALRDVTMDLHEGEIHALCGENGAGKSTLIRCLSGVTIPAAGHVKVNGELLRFGDVRAAESAGIAVIHQESTAFPDLNALDNIFVGREPRKWWNCFLDRAKMRREAADILEKLGENFNLECPVGQLSVANRQVVAMARALSHECRLLVMDEPTASLSARETQVLMELVRRLQSNGVTVLYVSHRLDEVFELADRVTVLRDGQLVVTRDIERIDRPELIRLMVGREIDESHRAPPGAAFSAVRLDVNGLSGNAFRDVSFSVRGGEILGLSGLVGAGRTEVARAIFGIDPYTSGQVLLDGKPLRGRNIQEAVRRGMAMVPEDRQHEGLVLPMSVQENLSLATLKRLTSLGLINRFEESQLVAKLMSKLQVRAAHHMVPAETLSGGNQQKLVLGKWLALRPRVLILDEPTRGVDVGAKTQVHELIRQLASEGMATMVISAEISELLALCHRTIVMSEGRIAGEVTGQASPVEILRLALPAERTPDNS